MNWVQDFFHCERCEWFEWEEGDGGGCGEDVRAGNGGGCVVGVRAGNGGGCGEGVRAGNGGVESVSFDIVACGILVWCLLVGLKKEQWREKAL